MAVRYWQLTTSGCCPSMSFNILFLDEFAFVPNHIADTSLHLFILLLLLVKSTKVIIVSTPHGMNHFYRMWTDGEES